MHSYLNFCSRTHTHTHTHCACPQEESVAAWIVIAIFVAIDPHPDITMSPVARVPLALLPIIAMVLYARYGLGLRPKSL